MYVNEITKHGVPLLFRTPEALKTLNNKTFTRKIKQISLTFTSAKHSVSSMLCSWLVVNCEAKDFSIKLAYSDYSTQLKVNRLRTSLLFHCVANGVKKCLMQI